MRGGRPRAARFERLRPSLSCPLSPWVARVGAWRAFRASLALRLVQKEIEITAIVGRPLSSSFEGIVIVGTLLRRVIRVGLPRVSFFLALRASRMRLTVLVPRVVQQVGHL